MVRSSSRLRSRNRAPPQDDAIDEDEDDAIDEVDPGILFKELDVDDSGYIDADIIRDAANQLQFANLTSVEFYTEVTNANIDNDGMIDQPQFLELVRRAQDKAQYWRHAGCFRRLYRRTLALLDTIDYVCMPLHTAVRASCEPTHDLALVHDLISPTSHRLLAAATTCGVYLLIVCVCVLVPWLVVATVVGGNEGSATVSSAAVSSNLLHCILASVWCGMHVLGVARSQTFGQVLFGFQTVEWRWGCAPKPVAWHGIAMRNLLLSPLLLHLPGVCQMFFSFFFDYQRYVMIVLCWWFINALQMMTSVGSRHCVDCLLKQKVVVKQSRLGVQPKENTPMTH
jgi:hypothetical protein